VEQKVGQMLMEIDDECLTEAHELSITLETLSLDGLNVAGINPNLLLIEQLDKLVKESDDYDFLVEMIVQKMERDFDAFI
jgi:hypothetical protein